MKPHLWLLIVLPAAALGLAGCGKSASSAAGQDTAEAEGETSSVAYREGHGLQFSPEGLKALSLTTADVTERKLAAEISLTAQIFTTHPRLLAIARIPAQQADPLEKSKFTGAKIERIDRAAVAATGLADLVFELGATPTANAGDFVALTLTLEPAAAMTVPRSAVLDGATGTFVYVVNGGSYLRTPVRVGARSAEFVEISDGLLEGDVVVVTPVNQLWLTELRLTKGGGHSH